VVALEEPHEGLRGPGRVRLLRVVGVRLHDLVLVAERVRRAGAVRGAEEERADAGREAGSDGSHRVRVGEAVGVAVVPDEVRVVDGYEAGGADLLQEAAAVAARRNRAGGGDLVARPARDELQAAGERRQRSARRRFAPAELAAEGV